MSDFTVEFAREILARKEPMSEKEALKRVKHMLWVQSVESTYANRGRASVIIKQAHHKLAADALEVVLRMAER